MRRLALLLAFAPALFMSACDNFDGLSSQYGHDAAVEDQAAPGADLSGDLRSANDDLGDNGDLADNCSNGVLDPRETDVDCGGVCGPCDVGLLCLLGTDCQTGVCELGRCELASGPPAWLPVGTAPTGANTAPIARNDVSAVSGPDGNIYVVGGVDGNGNFLNNVEALSGSALTFSSTNNLTHSRSLCATAANGTVALALYGEKGSGFETSYEHMTNPPNWNSPPNLTYTAAGAGAAFGSDGRVYVVGGSDGSGALSAARAFALADNNLTTLHGLLVPRGIVSVAAGSDGRIYALGGQSGATTLGSAEAYTIATDTWTQVASLPEPRAATQAVLAPDGRIYVPGGANLGSGVIYDSVAAYRAGPAPRADRWAEVAPLAQPRQRHGVALGSDGRVYVFSGSNLLGFVRTTEAYGPPHREQRRPCGTGSDDSSHRQQLRHERRRPRHARQPDRPDHRNWCHRRHGQARADERHDPADRERRRDEPLRDRRAQPLPRDHAIHGRLATRDFHPTRSNQVCGVGRPVNAADE